MKYITMKGEFLKNFKPFGRKIYCITCTRRSCGDVFYENEFTIVYTERWFVRIYRSIKRWFRND